MELIVKQLEGGISAEIAKKSTLDREGVSEWLLRRKLIDNNEYLTFFTDLQPWTRTGGETYSAIFEFASTKKLMKIFVKAIVTYNPEKSLLDWTRRRNLLKENKIPVSNWYWFGEATIFEQYYPNEGTACNPLSLIKIGCKLDKLGFTTLKFIDDIRCDEKNNPYFVDFGFDLGEPSYLGKKAAFDYFISKYPQLHNEIINFYNKNRY